jgi:hypothetical protein
MKNGVSGTKKVAAFSFLVLFPLVFGFLSFAKPFGDESGETQEEREKQIPFAQPEESSLINNGTRIQIRTEKPGESVYINRNFHGKTPLTVKNLVPGTYSLKIGEEEFEIEVKSNHFDRYFFLSGKNL